MHNEQLCFIFKLYIQALQAGNETFFNIFFRKIRKINVPCNIRYTPSPLRVQQTHEPADNCNTSVLTSCTSSVPIRD